MSAEHVDLVLAFIATYNARDMDAGMELCAADVTAFPDTSIYPEAGSLTGRDQLRGLLEDSWSPWESFSYEPEEVHDIGDGRVLARGDWGGKGTASGAEAYQSLSTIYTVRDGLIARVEWFFDHERALEAAAPAAVRAQPTSDDTVALARRVMDTLRSRDPDRVLELADDDVEWHSFFAQLGEGGVYRGQEGTRRFMADLRDAWETVSAEVDDAVGVGDVAVLVGRIRYRGKGSGIEAATPAGWMFKFRGGKVLRFRAFREPEQALEAVGLR